MQTNHLKIKTVHLPEQKGFLKDYWVAIYEGNIEWGESEEEAINKIKCSMELMKKKTQTNN